MTYRDTSTLPDGLASAPGLAFDSEPQTGFYRPAAGQIGLAVGGVSVAKFDANGQQAGAITKELTFEETTGNGTYTGTIALPAGARILDIGVDGQALWTASTSASLKVGDDADDDGFFVATNLKATDLLAGEINNLQHPGGLAGVYIASEQRNLYSAAARNVVVVITKVGTGTAGRTRVYCTYTVPSPVAVAKV
jgi:hypothetical protein